MKSLKDFAAYQGGSWQPRRRSHAQERRDQVHGVNGGHDSEYSSLEVVVLMKPPRRPPRIAVPEKVQHLRFIDWKKFRRNFFDLKKAYEHEGVRVIVLDPEAFRPMPPNLMFVRDQFLATPWGVIIGRLASEIRAGEESWTQLALARANVPILARLTGRGTFEGADALWINPRRLLIGTGNRTNTAAVTQIRQLVQPYGVRVQTIRLPSRVQHLLGCLQIVDGRTAFIRHQIVSRTLIKIMRDAGYTLIPVAETREVTENQGLNFVSVASKRIIMAKNCPALRAQYEHHGLEIAREVEISEYLAAAGGIACATGILQRGLLRHP